MSEKQSEEDESTTRSQKKSKTQDSNVTLKILAGQLSDPALKSSARIVILISLSINKKLSFVELLELTGLGKGSLENHLQKLSDSEYVTTKNFKTFGGLRETVEITGKGREVCRSLLTELKSVED
jgi:DNA-binding MarR family transcriptional regulator